MRRYAMHNSEHLGKIVFRPVRRTLNGYHSDQVMDVYEAHGKESVLQENHVQRAFSDTFKIPKTISLLHI